MAATEKRKLPLEEYITKYKERFNREPRNANELIQFSKKLRGAAPLPYGDARKYFQQLSRDPPQNGRVATEEKQVVTPFQVGDNVVLTKDRTGVIKFVGNVKFGPGMWYGVELHDQFVGRCDGSKEGERYFTTGRNRGMFVQERKIRRKMGRKDHERKESWMAANAERNTRAGIGSGASSDAESGVQEDGKELEDGAEVDEQKDDLPATEERPAEAVEEKAIVVQVDDLDFYPAKEGENLLQFCAKQSDMNLRSDLLDLYTNPELSAALRTVFEDLKSFNARVQNELLLHDLLPRLKQLVK